MDEMVLITQEWLNDTYGDNPGYIMLDLDDDSIKGRTGWDTIYALTRAFQIELGITATADNFGPTTESKFNQRWPSGIHPAGDTETDNVYGIIQGALWCKGYATHYQAIDTHFDEVVEDAIKELKTDAGLVYPNGVVTLNVMKALLSMDYFVIGYGTGGDNGIRLIQQELNRNYEDYIGLMPCDGIYGRNTNKALIYALQAEEGLPLPGTGTIYDANGNFGNTTTRCCPTIPYNNVTTDFNGDTYSTLDIINITRLLQHSLYCNGFGTYGASGSYDTDTIETIKEFQNFYALEVTGVADIGTWKSLLTSCGDTSRPAKGFDCATILTPAKAQTLVNEGYEIGGRYLSGTIVGGASKALSSSEIQIIFDAGLRFFPIYQAGGYYLEYFTAQQGTSDAYEAYSKALALGIPSNTIIYFAVDFDAMDYQITNNVIPYFEAVFNRMQRLKKYKVGIYGARNICSRVCDAGYAVSSFVGDMSTGFSGNLGFPIPENWAFDQFATITIGSGEGEIEIDKDGYSGRDTGVSYVEQTSSLLNKPFDDDKYDELENELSAYVDSHLDIFHTLVSWHSSKESLDTVLQYDDIVTDYCNRFNMQKELLQTVFFREQRFVWFSDDVADSAVIASYNYDAAYEEWLKNPIYAPPVKPILYRHDCSTGLCQIFAATAIKAINYAVNNGIITDERIYDSENLEDLKTVWYKLKDEPEFNIKCAALTLVFESLNTLGYDDDFANYTYDQIAMVFTKYNSLEDEPNEYGQECTEWYKIFRKYR